MKIAILTSFKEFPPGYSLTGIVKDQIAMLLEAGDEPVLFVVENYNDSKHPGPRNCEIKKVLPDGHLIDYQSKGDMKPESKELAMKTTAALVEHLQGFDIVFTHDLIFTGWHVPYGLGIKRASRQLENIKGWFHWVHSIPSGNRDYWTIKQYGPNHKIVFPNATDALRVAEQFRGEINDVRVVPHIKDPRSFFGFGQQALDIVDKMPNLLQADIVQILPASVDRLHSKRVLEVIRIFANLKLQGHNVALLIANQHATTRTTRECVNNYEMYAWNCGLTAGKEFAFTSQLSPEYETGISGQTIRDLFMLSNLFVFPTREESFGLVVAEAALCGCLLVLNRSLPMQAEISGHNALYFDFGSFCINHKIENPEKYFSEIAKIILGCMSQDAALRLKTFFRIRYNWTALYKTHYLPMMGEVISL